MLPNEMDVVISGSTHKFTLTSLVDGRSTRMSTSPSSLALPVSLTLAHSATGKGDRAVDSYLLRLDEALATQVDEQSNVQMAQTCSAYLVIKVPRAVHDSRAQAQHLGTALYTLAQRTFEGSTLTVLARMVRGEL